MPMPKPFAGPSGVSRATSESCSAWPSCFWALRLSSRLLPSWLGVLLVVGGLLSLAIGVSVGYAGLESGFQDAVALAFQLVVLAFIVGLLVVGRRARDPGNPASA